jgi:hypothetical protein
MENIQAHLKEAQDIVSLRAVFPVGDFKTDLCR